MTSSTPLHVLTIPGHHPYISAVSPLSVEPVASERTVAWEPDPVFTPGAVAALAPKVDLVHVHFGYDHLDAVAMRNWLAELADHRIPLVVTVHDLRNPHHRDRDVHDQLLAELTADAAGVITLTDGAATEIAAKFGMTAEVIPHPTLVSPDRTDDVVTEPGLVTVHLKSLRANLVDPLPLVQAIAHGVRNRSGRLRVDAHPGALDDPRLSDLDRIAGIEVNVHPRFDDRELERYIRRAHVSVLPHRWGTHSGWLELARDLGTRIVAPDCGNYAEQWPEVVTYTNNETVGLDASSLSKAVADALDGPVAVPADRASRMAQMHAIRDAHERLYRRLLAP